MAKYKDIHSEENPLAAKLNPKFILLINEARKADWATHSSLAHRQTEKKGVQKVNTPLAY
jgi:hypothetical protein